MALLEALSLAPTAATLVGLAVVVAVALLLVAAAAGIAHPRFTVVTPARRFVLFVAIPRLSDPDAAGRPRPRAPTQYPAF
jgi:hypothetical protein